MRRRRSRNIALRRVWPSVRKASCGNPSDNWLDPIDPAHPSSAGAGGRKPDDEEHYSGSHVYYDARGVAYTYGTINMNAVTAKGDVASVTTTSGLSWKIPGRRIDRPRRSEHQGLRRVPRRGVHAQRRLAAGSAAQGHEARDRDDRRPADGQRQADVPAAVLRREQEGRVRGRLLLRGLQVRRGRRERRARRRLYLHVQEVGAADEQSERHDDQTVITR